MLTRIIPLAFLVLLACSSMPVWAGEPSNAFDGAVRILPDLSKSPAALDPDVVRPGITVADICPHANTKAIRNVPKSEADAVYAEYGMERFKGICAALDPATRKPAGCEVDHICSLVLGCSNSVKNLWIQPYAGTVWNAHVKDGLEVKLHALVCAGKVTLADAQHEISTDWITAYKKYIGPTP
jgi:hypothetical protein